MQKLALLKEIDETPDAALWPCIDEIAPTRTLDILCGKSAAMRRVKVAFKDYIAYSEHDFDNWRDAWCAFVQDVKKDSINRYVEELICTSSVRMSTDGKEGESIFCLHSGDVVEVRDDGWVMKNHVGIGPTFLLLKQDDILRPLNADRRLAQNKKPATKSDLQRTLTPVF